MTNDDIIVDNNSGPRFCYQFFINYDETFETLRCSGVQQSKTCSG